MLATRFINYACSLFSAKMTPFISPTKRSQLERKLYSVLKNDDFIYLKITTFRVSRRRREIGPIYCVSVCVSVRGCMPTVLHGLGCNLGSGRTCP